MKNKLIVTDMDGTLIDTCRANYEAYSFAVETCSGRIETISFDEFKEKCFGKNYRFFLEKVYLIDDESLRETIHIKKNAIYSDYYTRYASLNVWLIDLIEKMRSECYITMITTASRDSTNSILEHFGVMQLFDAIITAEDVKELKPNTEALCKLIEKFNVLPKDTLFLDDAKENLLEASKLGCATFKVESF